MQLRKGSRSPNTGLAGLMSAHTAHTASPSTPPRSKHRPHRNKRTPFATQWRRTQVQENSSSSFLFFFPPPSFFLFFFNFFSLFIPHPSLPIPLYLPLRTSRPLPRCCHSRSPPAVLNGPVRSDPAPGTRRRRWRRRGRREGPGSPNHRPGAEREERSRPTGLGMEEGGSWGWGVGFVGAGGSFDGWGVGGEGGWCE